MVEYDFNDMLRVLDKDLRKLGLTDKFKKSNISIYDESTVDLCYIYISYSVSFQLNGTNEKYRLIYNKFSRYENYILVDITTGVIISNVNLDKYLVETLTKCCYGEDLYNRKVMYKILQLDPYIRRRYVPEDITVSVILNTMYDKNYDPHNDYHKLRIFQFPKPTVNCIVAKSYHDSIEVNGKLYYIDSLKYYRTYITEITRNLKLTFYRRTYSTERQYSISCYTDVDLLNHRKRINMIGI
jgi:hypothetical protein